MATRVAGLPMQRRVVPVIAPRVAFRITTKPHTRKTREGTDRIGVAWRDVVNLGRYVQTFYHGLIWLTYALEHQWTAVPPSDVNLIVVMMDIV